MITRERNFNSFLLGDNPAQLAHDLLPEIAAGVGFSLGDGEDPALYSQLTKKLGSNKVLRENDPAGTWTINEAADLVYASGIQEALDRSLWTPDIVTPDSADRIATGAVANWQDRSTKLLKNNVGDGKLWLPMGNRIMSSATEIDNPNITTHHQKYDDDDYPTEVEYGADTVITSDLLRAGYKRLHLYRYETGSGTEIAEEFVAEQPELFDDQHQVAFARVANSGVVLAAQFRKAARTKNSGFDADSKHPQVFVLTDQRDVARTQEQIEQPAIYQSPHTALRQLAATGAVLAEIRRELQQ